MALHWRNTLAKKHRIKSIIWCQWGVYNVCKSKLESKPILDSTCTVFWECRNWTFCFDWWQENTYDIRIQDHTHRANQICGIVHCPFNSQPGNRWDLNNKEQTEGVYEASFRFEFTNGPAYYNLPFRRGHWSRRESGPISHVQLVISSDFAFDRPLRDFAELNKTNRWPTARVMWQNAEIK